MSIENITSGILEVFVTCDFLGLNLFNRVNDLTNQVHRLNVRLEIEYTLFDYKTKKVQIEKFI